MVDPPCASVRTPAPKHLYFSQPRLDFFLCFLRTRFFDRQIHSIPFNPAAGGEAFQHGALRAELPDGLETAPQTVSAVRVERDDGLSFQAVLAQKALHRRWQPHAPGRKANEHDVVLLDAIDLRLQRREIAGFIFAGDLLHDRVVISWIWSFQFERDDRPADFLVDELCDRLGVVGSGQVDGQYLLLRRHRLSVCGRRLCFGTTGQETDGRGDDQRRNRDPFHRSTILCEPSL
jgi:hypothetical protein